MTSEKWPDRQQILQMASGFRSACVLGGAAELNVFDVLTKEELSAEQLAERLGTDLRAMRMLLDAAAALRLLAKRAGRYSVPAELRPLLASDSPQTIVPMILHSINILRNWAQLAWVVKSGVPADHRASIRGEEADRAAFIGAMHSISGPMADDLVARLGPPQFNHLLDVGGASGTWTLAFLRAVLGAQATIFDLPDAITQACDRLARSEFSPRVHLVSGDFYTDDLPRGCDFAWVSAIAHQHSREHNRRLFAKVYAALEPGGRIAIRDIVMDADRTQPLDGALFAINMLVQTESGGTFTFDEYSEDLRAVGFVNPTLVVSGTGPFAMNSVIAATKVH
jgi:SAM-dependent methyltransferase